LPETFFNWCFDLALPPIPVTRTITASLSSSADTGAQAVDGVSALAAFYHLLRDRSPARSSSCHLCVPMSCRCGILAATGLAGFLPCHFFVPSWARPVPDTKLTQPPQPGYAAIHQENVPRWQLRGFSDNQQVAVILPVRWSQTIQLDCWGPRAFISRCVSNILVYDWYTPHTIRAFRVTWTRHPNRVVLCLSVC